MKEIVQSFRGRKVLVVGDIVLDRYIYGDVTRLNPEAPVPVLNPTRTEIKLGGAANTATNLVSLGACVTLLGQIGTDGAGKKVKSLLNAAEITAVLAERDDIPTSTKTRLVARGQHMVRIDREKVSSLTSSQAEALANEALVSAPCAIVVSDYAKGVITPALMVHFERSGIPLFVGPKPKNIGLYSGAQLLSFNFSEASEVAGKVVTDATIDNVGPELAQRLGCTTVITRGSNGCSVFTTDGRALYVPPAKVRRVTDVVGAGDTFLAALCLSLVVGATLQEACTLANQAAGIAVEKEGTAAVSASELIAAVAGTDRKILDEQTLCDVLSHLRSAGKKIVFTNGCFDILHAGHVRMLKEAKQLGDILVLALNTDASVRRVKGPERPINSEKERAEVLASLEPVDYITFFDDDSSLRLLQLIKPDMFVKGNQLSEDGKKEVAFVESYGGVFKLLGSLHDGSTTKTIEKIRTNPVDTEVEK